MNRNIYKHTQHTHDATDYRVCRRVVVCRHVCLASSVLACIYMVADPLNITDITYTHRKNTRNTESDSHSPERAL